MARTYAQLKDVALKLNDLYGSTDAGTVVEAALEESMKYVANRTDLAQLIGSAEFTWAADTTSVPLFTDQGFDIAEANWAAPNRLYVREPSTATAPGVPYEYVKYMSWLDLSTIPAEEARPTLFSSRSYDGRPDRAWTIDLANAVCITPVSTGNVITLFYNKPPAAYSANAYPEILPQYDSILITGASLVLDYWKKEPDFLMDINKILSPLDEPIREMDLRLGGSRHRFSVHPSHRYQI